MLLEAGDVIDGKYRLVRVLGTGGMGAVYEGENVLIRRRVAIKVLHAANTTRVEAVRRFEREAQAAGEIGNDHILEVLDLGSLPNGDRYLVMEYLDGETLADRIQRLGRLTPRQIAPLARQFLEALVSAHAAGIIHRDLKPENIFIVRSKAGRTDFVKLIDFGISKFSRTLEGKELRMTREDAVLGTPCYMSPEQARGASGTDARSDIYSCGVILFEAVTGKLPFEGTSFNDLMFKIALSDAPSPLSFVPELDPDFCGIINRAIARDPTDRFPSALQFAQAIDDWTSRNGLPSEGLLVASPDVSSRAAATVRNTPTLDPPPPVRERAISDDDLSRDEKTSPAMNRLPEHRLPEDLRKTGTDESWARSKNEPFPQNPAASKRRAVAFASIAGIAAVAIGMAVFGRTTPSSGGDPGASTASPARPAAVSAAPPTATPAASSAILEPVPVAEAPAASVAGPLPAASTTPAVRRDPAAKPQPSARPPAAAAKTKPKAATTVHGFDLGY